MINNSIYDALADLLEYPDAGWHQSLDAIWERLASECPGALEPLLEFSRDLGDLELTALQERYTQTFDLNPVCTLDIGYHLFGENYKRGIFLANLRETEMPFQLEQAGQLPDYLPVLLRLLDKLEDLDLRQALISDCLVPALGKMIETLRQARSPYGGLVISLDHLLRSEVAVNFDEAASAVCETAGNPAPELYQISPMVSAHRQRSN
jgi:nitrate reductase delta subunit